MKRLIYISIFLILGFSVFFAVHAGINTETPGQTGLVGYWSFNDGSGSIAGDFSGNDNDGTLQNGPTWVDGKQGQALDFDGSDDYVAIDNLYFDTSGAIPEMTVSAWVKIPEGGGSWSILDFDRSEYFTFAEGRQSTDGTVEFDTTSSGGSTDDFGGTTNIEGGEWHHVVASKPAY